MTYTAKIISVNTLDKQKSEALAKVNDYLANQPSNVYGEAAKIANNQARAFIEAASSIEEKIEAALKLLDTKLDHPWQDDNKDITAGGNMTALPPQTGDAQNFAPFMLIVMAMAAVLFVACRRKRS
ncbi:MAG: LPXTG cell wall anchor domain-containing protein [Christensenellales bacterium]